MDQAPSPPDFSPLAGRYARSRPTYPREWFECLHRAAADHVPYGRSIRRLEIDGDRPYFDAAAPH